MRLVLAFDVELEPDAYVTLLELEQLVCPSAHRALLMAPGVRSALVAEVFDAPEVFEFDADSPSPEV